MWGFEPELAGGGAWLCRERGKGGPGRQSSEGKTRR